MRNIILVMCLLLCTSIHAQVGIGTTDPKGALDVVSETSGLIIPRVLNTGAITAPVDGMLIYDKSATCPKMYANGTWSDCLNSGGSGTSDVTVNNDCDVNGFEGSFINNTNFTENNKFTVTVTNNDNSFDSASIAFSTSDVVLSGTGLGSAMVSSVTPSSVTLASGQSQLVEYSLSGAPRIRSVTSRLD